MAQAGSSPTTKAPIPIVEDCVIPDIFCAELVRIDRIGPCCRLTFAVPQRKEEEHGSEVRAIVARLIVPYEELQAMARDLLSGRPVAPIVQRDDVSLH